MAGRAAARPGTQEPPSRCDATVLFPKPVCPRPSALTKGPAGPTRDQGVLGCEGAGNSLRPFLLSGPSPHPRTSAWAAACSRSFRVGWGVAKAEGGDESQAWEEAAAYTPRTLRGGHVPRGATRDAGAGWGRAGGQRGRREAGLWGSRGKGQQGWFEAFQWVPSSGVTTAEEGRLRGLAGQTGACGSVAVEWLVCDGCPGAERTHTVRKTARTHSRNARLSFLLTSPTSEQGRRGIARQPPGSPSHAGASASPGREGVRGPEELAPGSGGTRGQVEGWQGRGQACELCPRLCPQSSACRGASELHEGAPCPRFRDHGGPCVSPGTRGQDTATHLPLPAAQPSPRGP